MTKYATGARLERLIQQELEAEGYYTVRSAGSRGAFDVIAWNDQHIRLIQSKKAGISKAERKKMAKIVVPPNSLREVWERVNGKWRREIV